MKKTIGRFAPSPSGRMHLGNIYAALMSWLSARKNGGLWRLRIEDLDRQRCKPEYTQQLLDDLQWLGLTWDREVMFQSQRDNVYQLAYERLYKQGLVYDCYCRRADLHAASAPHATDGTVIYSGHCRNLTQNERQFLSQTRLPAKRIATDNALISFVDGQYGLQQCRLASDCGDFIIQRADGNFAYQLAVVVDDAAMGITEVVRGRDLLSSTHQQLFLYKKLDFCPPQFFHIPLLLDAEGRRLSKRNKDMDMGILRQRFVPQELIGRIMHSCGFIERSFAISLEEALSIFNWKQMPKVLESVAIYR